MPCPFPIGVLYMKKIEGLLYEEGDLVLITAGHNKGMVGIVDVHDGLGHYVYYYVPERGNYIEDGCSDYESPANYLKHITKKEADSINSKRKFLKVMSCDETCRIENNELIVGCQTINAKDALLISKFIKDNITIPKKTTKKVSKKKRK